MVRYYGCRKKQVKLIIQEASSYKDYFNFSCDNVSAVAFCYGINNKASFLALNSWITKVDENCIGAPIGNNSSNNGNEKVSLKELKQFEQNYNIAYYKVIKNEKFRDFDELFSNLVNKIFGKIKNKNNDGNGCYCLIVLI